MKQCSKPTLKQKKIMLKNNMDPDLYLVDQAHPDRLECVSKVDGRKKQAFLKLVRI
ncbi:MAG: hypothetical protein WD469_12280 [Paenibacillaceae bacterium]